MTRCEEYRQKLLDHRYGLLDAAESADVETHLADCPVCVPARAEADRLSGLLGRAAKGIGPDISFSIPAHPIPAVKPADTSTLLERSGQTVVGTFTRWCIAAGLLLAFAAFGGPPIRDIAGQLSSELEVRRELAKVQAAQEARDSIQAEINTARADAEEDYADSRKDHDELVAAWAKAEESARIAATNRTFSVNVTGPSAAVPGAPNEYSVQVADRDGRPHPAVIEASVKDQTGRVFHSHSFPEPLPPRGGAFRLPPQMWAGVRPGSDLFLHFSAVDPRTGTKSELTEKLRLAEPVYNTFLTTDRPLYRPGEMVFFRSLTLDRNRFFPPTKDQSLRFELRGPTGQIVPGCELVGQAKPARSHRDGATDWVKGPNGTPVRGVGTGAFRLPRDLPNGQYTLVVHDLPPNAYRLPRGAKPLASRPVFVGRYTPERLLKSLEFNSKSYGPGDTVQANLVVTDQGNPAAGVALRATATANGRPIVGVAIPSRTNPDGTATIRFTLPAEGETTEANLTVSVFAAGSPPEVVNRRVPLATQIVALEFFPEGGDMIAGVPNRVYFRSATSLGKPVDVQGVLTDGNRAVATVRTLTDPEQPGANQGLGAFTFTPELGRRYTVQLDKPLGLIHPPGGHPLPEVKADGVAITVPDGVTKPGEPIRLSVWSAGTKRSLLVGAYVHGVPVDHERAVTEPGKPTEIVLHPQDDKIGGVARITVFEEPAAVGADAQPVRPVAERLVFRRPGETLKLDFVVRNPDGSPQAIPFAPGNKVRLDIAAANEADAPTPAVLWAAVVNQHTVSAANETTTRLLPTHFLLCGEVRSPEGLEHADFLLSDHPSAGAALDLLLGTQGWRRFAEQAPDRFRATASAEDADRLLTASAGRGPVPLGGRSGSLRVFDEHWPRYESALMDLEEAKQKRDRVNAELATGEPIRKLAAADAVLLEVKPAFWNAVHQRAFFGDGPGGWRNWLPVSAFALLTAAGLLMVAGRFIPRLSRVRGPMFIGAIGLVTLTAFLIVSDRVIANADSRLQEIARAAETMTVTPRTDSAGVTQKVEPFVSKAADTVETAPADTEASPRALQPQAMMLRAGAARTRPPVTSVPILLTSPIAARPDLDVEETKPTIEPPVVRAELVRQLPELAEAARKLATSDFAERVLNTAREAVPNTPPLVIREYAHSRPTTTGDAKPDFAETLLWHPVLVVPDSGKASVTFTLSDSEAPYQVIVAGHTLDGRIGAVAGRIEVRK